MIKFTVKSTIKRITNLIVMLIVLSSCNYEPTSDEVQQEQQEAMLKEGTSSVGMPAIKNFRERRLLKMILELRDQEDLNTFTYLWSNVQGKYVFFCNSIGYGVPYATQFTNPMKAQRINFTSTYTIVTVPQADPNGLFSPSSAEGTWVMCKNPQGPDVKPVFIEPRIIVSPFELPDQTPVKLDALKTTDKK